MDQEPATIEEYFASLGALLGEQGAVPDKLVVPRHLYSEHKDAIQRYVAAEGITVVVEEGLSRE